MKQYPLQTLRARKLRHESTDAEKKLWYAINRNQLGVKFRRQRPIGPYYVDFVCLEKMLVIELDGDQHADNIEYDNRRTDYLESQGYKVIRIPNSYIYKELSAVVYSLKLFLDGIVPVEHFFQSRYE